jgi:outer membrane protein OmpA-like peptidoglycan-associated protein
MAVLASLLLPCLAAAAPPAKPGVPATSSPQAKPAAPAKPAPQTKPAPAKPKSGSLGSKEPGLFNLVGSIYFLVERKEIRMPADLATRKSEGTVFTDRIDVPVRRFTEGFPGITDRFAWFGILYTGRFFIEVPGEYAWQLQSDDGSRLWIDGKPVIDYDGVHTFGAKRATVTLTKGPHDIGLWYFQGPPTEIGLVMKVKGPGDKDFAVFDLANFAGPMAEALKTLKAEATPDGIRVRLDAALLFDTAKWDLKPKAQQAIRNLGRVIAAYPAALIRVVGFTDSVGSDESNLELSRQRATSVRDALAALDPPAGVTFETEGLGETRPVASNDTEAGRALNRRVEVFIKPTPAATAFDATALPGVQNLPKAPAPATQARSTPPAQPPAGVSPPTAPAKAPPPPTPGLAPAVPGPKPNSPDMAAAVSRVKYVVEQYAAALGNRDEQALGSLRTAITDAERTLLQARALKVSFEVASVDVVGTSATVAGQRSIEGTAADGSAIRGSGPVTLHLVRRPAGWTITDIK